MARNVALWVVLLLFCMIGVGCGDIDGESSDELTGADSGQEEDELVQCVEGFIEEPLAFMIIEKSGASGALMSPEGFEGARIEVVLKKIYNRRNEACSNPNTGDSLTVSLHRAGVTRAVQVEKFHFKSLEMSTKVGFRIWFNPFEERKGDFFFIQVSSTACLEVEINKIAPACLVRK